MTDSIDWRERMTKDWNERALDDPYFWTVNSRPRYTWEIDDFLYTGEQTYLNEIEPFLRREKLTPPEMTAVEVGCGAGRMTVALAKRFKYVTGVDISDVLARRANDMLQYAQLADKGHCVKCDNDLSMLADGSVDFATSIIALQHIPDPALQLAYIREFGRVLRPGGAFLVIFFDDWNEYQQQQRAWAVRRAANNVLGWDDLAALELPRYETSIRTPVEEMALLSVLTKGKLRLTRTQGKGTEHWWVGGRKE
ncbi:MAG: class I SAM-dependent methyltransferase [Anaerolineae bacterium]|nr:class I SAM-dependent methyltransferase [Anaerolineae bacterium]